MDVRRAARVVLVQLLDAETGERGFLLTGDDKFLEPFNRAERSVPGALDRLLALTSDNAAQLARLAALKPKVEAMMAKLRRTVALVRQGQPAEATAIIKSGVGRDMMDAIRADLDVFVAEESKLLAVRQAEARTLRTWVLGLIGLCLAPRWGWRR